MYCLQERYFIVSEFNLKYQTWFIAFYIQLVTERLKKHHYFWIVRVIDFKTIFNKIVRKFGIKQCFVLEIALCILVWSNYILLSYGGWIFHHICYNWLQQLDVEWTLTNNGKLYLMSIIDPGTWPICNTLLWLQVTLSISILISLHVFFLLVVEIIPPTSLVVPLLGKYLIFAMILVSIRLVLLFLYKHQSY